MGGLLHLKQWLKLANGRQVFAVRDHCQTTHVPVSPLILVNRWTFAVCRQIFSCAGSENWAVLVAKGLIARLLLGCIHAWLERTDQAVACGLNWYQISNKVSL